MHTLSQDSQQQSDMMRAVPQMSSSSRKEAPPRYTSTIPPMNYGAVQTGQIYRSAFPQPKNVDFMADMGLKTILCLVETENSSECSDFIDQYGIRRIRIDIAANKDGQVRSSLESIYEAVLVAMDVANYPMLIHCNQGRHRTGCVVACLRVMQGWATKNALDEYEIYANPKMREGDQKLISEIFEPEAMLDYLKTVQIDHRPSLMRLLKSDLVDVAMLCRILASMDGVLQSHPSLQSNTSSKADSGVDVSMGGMDDCGVLGEVDDCMTIIGNAGDIGIERDVAVEISVDEVGPMSPPIETA